jgi:N-acetyl-anhydromuramyl-L-alanine amidase AmpD
VVAHIIEGSLLSAIQEFTGATQKSAHFAVGKDGSIKQFVSIYDTAYANGLSWSPARKCWVDPQGIALKAPRPEPTWEGLTPPINPNLTTISIEHEGHYQDTPTEAMERADVAILRYLAGQFSGFRAYTPHVNLIGHWEISPVNRKNCPGPHFDYEGLATAANGPKPTLRYIARHTQAVFEAPRADSKVALADTARIIEGAQVELDEVRPDGFGHLASGLGFVPVGVLSEVK